MSERYKQVKLYDNFKFCPTCPVDILRGAIYIDNMTNNAVFQLKFVNMQDKDIKALYVQIKGSNDLGQELTNEEYQYLDLNISEGREFGTEQLKELNNNTIRNIEITINKVIYADNEVWENKSTVGYDRTNLQCVDDNMLSIASKKATEQRLQLNDIYYPTQNDNYWTCVCGTYNSNDNDECYKCKCNKEFTFSQFNNENLRLELEQYKIKKENIKSELKKKLKKYGILVIILIIMIPVVTSNTIRYLKYITAKNDLENGNYEISIEKFNELGNYKDSENLKSKAENAILENYKNKLKTYRDNLPKNDSIALGSRAIYIIKNDGTLDVIDTIENKVADVIKEWKNIKQISIGYFHMVGLKDDGTVVATGDNKYGQCDVSNWTDIVQVGISGLTTIGLKSDGTVVSTGSKTFDVSGWSNITQINTSYYTTIGLKSDGTVVATGTNTSGQCNVNDWTDIVQIAIGTASTIGLKSDGTVVATGSNNYGQCNVNDWSDIIQIATGSGFTVGLKSNGTVIATGTNTSGQCDVNNWTNIVQITTGDSFVVGLKSDGTVVATGDNKYGQCNVNGWSNIISVNAYGNTAVGITKDNTVVSTTISADKLKNVKISN